MATIGAGLPSGPDDEDLRVLYEAAGYFRDNPRLGEARGVFSLADSSESIARNLVALEDAYGLYIVGGAPIADEALRQILSFAAMATRCPVLPGGP